MKTVILGAKGLVGGQLKKLLPEAVGLDRADLDVTNDAALHDKLLELKPEAIINCVAYNDVDGAESNKELAFRLNAELVQNLANIANELDAILVHFSTGYVFDGAQQSYDEYAQPAPLSVYAESKLAGEKFASTAKRYYVVRTNLVFGPAGESKLSKKTFVDMMLQLSQKRNHFQMVNNEINSITYSVDLAAVVVGLLEHKNPYGLYHVTNSGSASWYDFAKEIFRIKNLPIELEAVPASNFPRPAKRPAYSVLTNTKLPPLRSWQDALQEYLTTNS